MFDKRVILYGSEGSVKTYTSLSGPADIASVRENPIAVVEAVDPIALNLRICDSSPCAETELRSIPNAILEAIGEDVSVNTAGKKLYATLGQFSIIRLERDYQITVAAENYLPNKECVGSSDDDPCTLFSRVAFPTEEFYPPDTVRGGECYRDLV